MGIIFKSLYIDKNSKEAVNYHRRAHELDSENSKIDITTCICILLARCKSAKSAAIDQNLIKKILEICQENSNALQMLDIQKLTHKSSSNKSTIGNKQSMIN